ncbi:hypothetical protein GCM10023162_40560 [Klenkia terrae]
MYQQYLADPGSVDQAWHDFFDDYAPTGQAAEHSDAPAEPAAQQPEQQPAAKPAQADAEASATRHSEVALDVGEEAHRRILHTPPTAVDR